MIKRLLFSCLMILLFSNINAQIDSLKTDTLISDETMCYKFFVQDMKLNVQVSNKGIMIDSIFTTWDYATTFKKENNVIVLIYMDDYFWEYQLYYEQGELYKIQISFVYDTLILRTRKLKA
jgi:hypothetical protein